MFQPGSNLDAGEDIWRRSWRGWPAASCKFLTRDRSGGKGLMLYADGGAVNSRSVMASRMTAKSSCSRDTEPPFTGRLRPMVASVAPCFFEIRDKAVQPSIRGIIDQFAGNGFPGRLDKGGLLLWRQGQQIAGSIPASALAASMSASLASPLRFIAAGPSGEIQPAGDTAMKRSNSPKVERGVCRR